MNLTRILGGLKVRKIGKALGLKERLGTADLGILKVAFMVAALDGEVTEAEYAAFGKLAKKCRGYTPAAADEAMKAAMRSAGYLMLLSKRAKEAELVKAFIEEARAILPSGFAYLSIEEIRRAVITWIVMGMSDGDYSAREKKCIEALRKEFAELKVRRLEAERECWTELATDFREAYGVPAVRPQGMVELVTRDFVERVEALVREYGDTAEAAKEFGKLISEGEVK